MIVSSSGYCTLPRLTVTGTIFSVLITATPFGLTYFANLKASSGSMLIRQSAPPAGIRLPYLQPMRTWFSTAPPRWAIPWVSADRTDRPSMTAARPMISEARITPWPPTPTMSKSNLSILSTPSLNGAELAYLRAHAASGTGVADEGLTVLDLHGRAPELHAALAALAQVVQHFELLSPDANFLSGDNAGLAGDDDLNAVGVVGFLECRLRRFQVKRIDDLERGHAAGLDERLERDLGGWLIQYVGAGSGVLLMAGHRRRPVIQDDDRYIRLIIDGVD